MAGVRWTEAETRKALFLYFQLPFGRLDKGTPEIIALADELNRSPSSVAMKLANFASLDPKITESGRKGLTGASALDRKIWGLFHDDWTKLIVETSDEDNFLNSTDPDNHMLRDEKSSYKFSPYDGMTSKRAEVEQRLGQNFFRRAVLANFDGACCITGIFEPRLLIASHISPWSADIPNRHNPKNGLCLSATFDRAFDAHLMTVTPDLKVRFSSQILNSKSDETRAYFTSYEGKTIRQPTSIALDYELLEAHNNLVAC